MVHQRGVSEKTHTKRAAARALARPAAAGAVWKFVGFYHQSQISSRVFRKGKICNGKNKGLALLDPFSYCFKMTLQKNVLLIDLRPCFHFYFSLLLQKTFLLIDLRPCFHFDDLLERCSIHLHLWIESKHRMNESNQWMEAMNRTNESNQRIESMNRITESRVKTMYSRLRSPWGSQTRIHQKRIHHKEQMTF